LGYRKSGSIFHELVQFDEAQLGGGRLLWTYMFFFVERKSLQKIVQSDFPIWSDDLNT
jgi:hypothetical protein